MRSLALHQITAPGTDALELIGIAAEVGCDGVCVFVHEPVGAYRFPVIGPREVPAVQTRLKDTGQHVMNVEFFPIRADTDVAEYLPSLILGATLGAKRAVTHIHDDDRARAADSLGRLCDLAASVELAVGLEFMGMTRGCQSLPEAVRTLQDVGRRNLAIAVDALHLVRSGGLPTDLLAFPPAHLAYAQLCDGHGIESSDSYMPEAMDRLMPGKGEFPLKELLHALPSDIDLDLEVPSMHLNELGLTPLEHVRRAVLAARTLL